MTSRSELIARKHEVQGRIQRTNRDIANERARGEAASRRKLRKLADELERLMAEEYRLRLEIDRSRVG